MTSKFSRVLSYPSYFTFTLLSEIISRLSIFPFVQILASIMELFVPFWWLSLSYRKEALYWVIFELWRHLKVQIFQIVNKRHQESEECKYMCYVAIEICWNSIFQYSPSFQPCYWPNLKHIYFNIFRPILSSTNQYFLTSIRSIVDSIFHFDVSCYILTFLKYVFVKSFE